MAKIDHNRNVLRLTDERKRLAAFERRLAKELEQLTQDRQHRPDRSRARTGHGPTILRRIAEAEKHYLMYGNWGKIISVIAELDERDADLVISIVHATINGFKIERSNKHASGFWISTKSPKKSKLFNQLIQLSLQRQGFRSKPVLRLIGRSNI